MKNKNIKIGAISHYTTSMGLNSWCDVNGIENVVKVVC